MDPFIQREQDLAEFNEDIATPGTSFESWWNSDGKFYDPDTEDVPWYYKRKALAEYAWNARTRQ